MDIQRDRHARAEFKRSAALLTAWLFASGLVLGVGPAHADEQGGEMEAAAPTIEIDVEAMLRGERLLESRVEGAVWRIEAREGRQLLYLPLVVRPGDAEVELSQPPIDIRGGYFIAWHVPQPERPQERARDRGRRDRQRTAQPADVPERQWQGVDPQRILPGRRAPQQQQPDAPAQRRDAQREPVAADADSDVRSAHITGFPEGAPEFARRLTIRPDGQVQWRVGRTIRDGEVHSGADPWLVKVRPDRVRELMPEPPADRRDREAMRRYQDERREVLEFQRALRDLPDEFTTPIPPRIGAVYAIMEARSDIEFSGDAPDLPWTIERDDLEMLRSFASRQRGGQGPLAGDQLVDVRQMVMMVRGGEPLTARAVAYALHASQTTTRMRPRDMVHLLVESIIDGPDDHAAQRVLRDLAMAEPPTDATLGLLRDAAGRMDSQTRLVALHGMLRNQPEDLQQQRELFRAANYLLADAAAHDTVPPSQALELMLSYIDADSHLLRDAAHGVDFAYVPDQQRDHVIAFVIRRAGEHPLAESWLDQRLLGTPEPELALRTLELLNQADTGPTPMRPMVQAMFDLVLDRRGAHDARELDDVRRPLDLHVEALIPLSSESHSLFRALNSGDRTVYELAWGALPLFYVPEGDSQQELAERYELIVDSALGRSTVPREVVVFLERQPDAALATRGLVRVALEADQTVAVDAVRALYASQRPIGAVLAELTPQERFDFTEHVYYALAGRSPSVVALMRQPSDVGDAPAVVRWFGDRLAEGHLPSPNAWTEPYANEDALLELAASDTDPDLARAAVAALAAAAGAETDMVEALSQRMTAESDRSVDDLRELWRSGRREIHARRLAQSTGDYRLVVQPPAEREGYGPPPPIVLGVVELVADLDSAYLGRNQTLMLEIPDDRFAIRIPQPNDLKNFPSREIADLPLRDIAEPMDLLPQPDGSWHGEAEMGRHGIITIRLEPVS